MTDDSIGATQWQERTVERSLKAARQRAISRGNTFIAAAVELLRTTGKVDFTVQEVVDRSGMSLRSFYQHFASKDDLLLAVVEETIRRHVEHARRRVETETEPVAKLRALLVAMFGSQETDDPASRGLALFHWHLADSRTGEFAASIQPYVDTVGEILAEGVAAGCFRADISVPVMAGLVT
ncbi:MAG TPA: TetR/AcrR family transcriptional regulator, partial [Acidimicrobiales bacterium]|nr:TetR/AcrR family transcriptional regulator [Acidimicrobiales bacterium]